ncbi:LPXTG cell wall anchor domain-containing protein [Micromonospora siamensis]|uniref:LPXTG-motif cell wall anchor domain-containing protein n=1 Tax=Micromonospora siamensis TaxID=299152 RepID=A0A1C5GYJ5_9ACTN|nr:LPXTG cell wall anchor domain-containing protein [Micromonospora siamensis]SCG38834.1 LPXTG-motif cell wall anchor domain-containing protein [Micromonospora siamensis]
MHSHPSRRWLAGLGVAGALVAVSAVPAAAAPLPVPDRQAQEYALYANNATVAPGGPAKVVDLYALTDMPFASYTVTVDRGAVAGFAVVSSAEGSVPCTGDGAILTCTVGQEREPELGLISLDVRATDTAKPGQHGELTFTVTGPDADTETFRSTVTVGEGVDLAAGDDLELRGAPGTTVPAPLTMTNVGGTDADGAVLVVAGSYDFAPSERYSNCEYATEAFVPNLFACTFDGKVPAGDSVVVSSSFGFTIPADAWAPDRQGGASIWLTKADWAEARDEVGLFAQARTRGTGEALRLTTRRSTQAVPQTDTDLDNNAAGLSLRVTGNQRTDVAANGARVKGAVGSVVPTTVGFTNKGPAALNTGGTESLFAVALVTLPAGTTAVKVPENCFADDGSGEGAPKPGASVYFCDQLETPAGKGAKVTFEFGLRVDKAGPLTGGIEVLTGTLRAERPDLDPTNNTAEILVNAPENGGGQPGDGGQPGNGGQPGDGGGGGGDQDGPTLPVTGSPASLIAGVGGLLLVAGVAGYLVAKRRRTRFVA